MKTVCKKLFSLLLVAALLVSAVPFQASATETVKCPTHPDATVGYRGAGNNGDIAATCGAAGTLSYYCNSATPDNRSDDHNFSVAGAPATGAHTWNAGVVTTAATCGAAGVMTYTCTGCNTTKTEPIAATGAHTYGAATMTKAPNCTEEGVNSFTCAACGGTKTESIKANGHTRNANGVCTVCEDVAEANYILSYHYLTADGVKAIATQSVKNGDTVNLPSIPLVSGKDFLKWVDEDGTEITNATVWNIGESQNITAVYEDDSTDDGIVELSVYAHYYVDGVYHHKVRLFVKNFEETSKNTMFTWLYGNDGIKQTEAALAQEGYQWATKIYYDYYDDGAVTESDLASDGNKAVYVKVTSKKAIEATVLLHVHTAKEYAISRTITMPGYTAGDYVSQAEALAAVKKFYTGNNMAISDLYDDGDWDDLLAGKASSGAKSVKVESNGTTEIHVVLTNATAKTSSNADSSNPKTGDSIMIAATAMVLAAGAFVALVEMKKRKMI